LLQAKVREPRFRFLERRQERGAHTAACVGQGGGQLREVGRGGEVAMAAQSLAHERLGEAAVGRAERRQSRSWKAAHGDGAVGKAAVAAGIFRGDPLEPGKEKRDRGNHERRLDHVGPRDPAAAGEAYRRFTCEALSHGPDDRKATDALPRNWA
jgi:hypothetical protein